MVRLSLESIRFREIWSVLDCHTHDFGVRAYSTRCPEDSITTLSVGQAIKGTLKLGIDYFVYMETFCKKPNVIPLIYSWHVDRIKIESGPRVQGEPLIVDKSRTTWHSAQTTHERISQRTGNSILTCSLIDVSPTADGEPLAKWDQVQIQKDMPAMKIRELQDLVKFYDPVIQKLGQLEKDLQTQPNADFVKDLMDIFGELGFEVTERNLSLSEKWIQNSEWAVEDYLNWVEACKENAHKYIIERKKEQS